MLIMSLIAGNNFNMSMYLNGKHHVLIIEKHNNDFKEIHTVLILTTPVLISEKTTMLQTLQIVHTTRD